MEIRNVIRATLASAAAASMVISLVPAANASILERHSAPVVSDSISIVNSQDQILIDEVAEHLLEGFQELDQYIISAPEGAFAADYEHLRINGIDSRDAASIQNLVSILNSLQIDRATQCQG
ncbi:hypothetical protein [Arcanobacterium canis]